MSKPKVGFYWCASCGGCEEAVVDLAEAILDVVPDFLESVMDKYLQGKKEGTAEEKKIPKE